MYPFECRVLKKQQNGKDQNRMGKTRDLLKKIRDTKGTLHAKMGTIKDRNGMDLISRRLRRGGQNTQNDYTKKIFMIQITMMVEPNILECEIKQALEASLQTKLVEVMEFQLSYFKS